MSTMKAVSLGGSEKVGAELSIAAKELDTTIGLTLITTGSWNTTLPVVMNSSV